MDDMITYFETIPTLHRSLILVGGITFFWVIEYIIPLFRFRYQKFSHAWPNIFFTLTTVIINFFMAFILLNTSDWTVANDFGLLQWIEIPLWEMLSLDLKMGWQGIINQEGLK